MIASGKISAANRRFAAYYLSELKGINATFAISGDYVSNGLQRFDADYPQIEHVLMWLTDHYHTEDEIASIFLQILEVGHNIFSKRLSSEKLLFMYQKGVQAAKQVNDIRATLLHQLAIADAYVAMSNIEEALEILEQVYVVAEEYGDKVYLAQCLSDLSFAYAELSNEEAATIAIDEAIALYRELNDRQNEGYCLYRLAQIARRKGEWDIANDYLTDAYQIAVQYENQAHLQKILGMIGELHERQGNIVAALEYKMRALELAQQMGNQPQIVFDMVGLGIAHDIKGDFSKAQEYYHQALKIANKMGFARQKSNLLGNLGYSAYMQRDYHTAKNYMQESLQMLRISGQKALICVTFANLVPVYIALDQTADAYQAVYEGLDLAIQLENKQLQVMMIVAAVQFYVFEVLKLEDCVQQHEIMSHVVRWSGFIYNSSYSDQENRGELDKLRPKMEQVLDQETVLRLLSDGATMSLEDVCNQVLSM